MHLELGSFGPFHSRFCPPTGTFVAKVLLDDDDLRLLQDGRWERPDALPPFHHWLCEHVGRLGVEWTMDWTGAWKQVDAVYFSRREDAALFLLRWSG